MAIIAAGCAAALGFGACGSEDPPETPSACIAPASAYLSALAGAPDPVRLDGTTPISDCLVEEQAAGPLTEVGGSMVEAATELNRQTRRGDARAAMELGYLVGAVDEGASSTGGIHRDLVLRVESAAGYGGSSGEGLPPGLQRDYDHGFDAGRATG
jgi:hypothetical protein